MKPRDESKSNRDSSQGLRQSDNQDNQSNLSKNSNDMVLIYSAALFPSGKRQDKSNQIQDLLHKNKVIKEIESNQFTEAMVHLLKQKQKQKKHASVKPIDLGKSKNKKKGYDSEDEDKQHEVVIKRNEEASL